MATILPEVAPRRGPFATLRFGLPRLRTPFLVLVVVLVGLAGAVGARAWTSRLPGPDRPGGTQLPLTTTVSLPAGPYNPAFTIRLPGEPRVLQSPTAPDGTILSAVVKNGSPIGVLLFVQFEGRSAREVIEALGGGKYPVTPIRRTSVAGLPAYTRDMTVGTRVVHEYRFEIDGTVYGFGIFCEAGDDVARDTGLAAMATVRFG